MSRFVDAYNEGRRSLFVEIDSLRESLSFFVEALPEHPEELFKLAGDIVRQHKAVHDAKLIVNSVKDASEKKIAEEAEKKAANLKSLEEQIERIRKKLGPSPKMTMVDKAVLAAPLLITGSMAAYNAYHGHQKEKAKQRLIDRGIKRPREKQIEEEMRNPGKIPASLRSMAAYNALASLSEGMNQQATALAVTAGLPIFAKGIAAIAAKSNNTSGKRKEAYEMLKRMGLKNPTDKNVDDYLIHRAGRRTREEEAHDKLDMPDTKVQRAGNMAAAGSLAGAALGLAAGVGAAQRKMGNGNIFTSIPAGALTPVRNIPTATAVGSMVGGVAGAYFGTRLWNAQKAEKDAQRPPSKRESESKFVAAYNESKERAAEALNPMNALKTAKTAVSKVGSFAKDVVKSSGNVARGVGKDIKDNAPEIAGGLTGLAVVDAASKSKKKPREEKETIHNGGDLNKNAKGMNSGKRDGDGDGKLNESFSGAGEDFDYLQDLLSESLKDSAKDAASKGLNFAKQGANVVGNKINQVAGPGATPKAMAGMGMIGAAALAHRAFKSLRAKGNMDPSDDDLHNEMRDHDQRYNNGGELNKNPVGMKNKPQAPAGKVWRFGKLVDETQE